MVNALHIVAFDVPAPPNYGGVIDIYYKVKALHELGCQIYLHCFQYGRPEATVLEPFCAAVWYYPRLTGIRGISLTLPYIVASRSNKELLKRLAAIDAPVLFEGIHTTYYLNHPSLRDRFKAIRVHNIEHDYTRQLASKPAPLLKKIYFNLEQRLLFHYEHGLQQTQAFFALSNTDGAFFEHLYPNSRHIYLPPFHSAEQPLNLNGKGTYLLYHGNLSHPENVEAALFLLREVLPDTDMPVVIAGMQPAAAVMEATKALPNCTLIGNPDQHQMDELVQHAQIVLLPTFQESGVKLKLLHSLFWGRTLIVSPQMITGTPLRQGFTLLVAQNADDFKKLIATHRENDWGTREQQERAEQCQYFNNRHSATVLLENMTPL